MKKTIQQQYDIICQYFKSTTEPFDELDWDGINLIVLLKNVEIEQYLLSDLQELIYEL